MVESMANPEDILLGLTDEQLAVATTFGVPIAVIAGAGTGKTRAITHRIAYAVASGRQEAAANLALTFTNRAAGQLRARLADLGVAQVSARTFHAAALRQLKFFWPKVHKTELPRIVSQTLPMVAAAADQLGLPDDISLLRDLGTEISWAKVSNVSPTRYESLASSLKRVVVGVSSEQVGEVFASYEAIKNRSGVIDFDDILLCTVAMLHEYPAIAEQIRDGYRYITVDEYQDVSPLQHTLLELWTDGRTDLCVVGDPDQSIHAFAGADRRWLVDFEKFHPGAKVLTLTKNFRSTPQVLAAANALLADEKHRHTLQATRSNGSDVAVFCAKDNFDEARQNAEWLNDMHDLGMEWSQLALLYRINAQSQLFEAALSELNIPYQVKDADNFYQRPEIKQALHQLRKLSKSGEFNEDGPAQVEKVVAKLGWLQQSPAGSGIQRARWESLNALLEFSKKLWQAEKLDFTTLVQTLFEKADGFQIPTTNAVTLASLHSAKGLEWDGVVVVGLNEGIIPISLAKSPVDLAEERRLLYVGLTRAKKYLRISWAGDKKASRYLDLLGHNVSSDFQPSRLPDTKSVAKCFVCGLGLTGGEEIALGRHSHCQTGIDEALLESLDRWRADKADEECLPPFVIISDKTLQAIAERKPATIAELAKLPGMRKEKIARYADTLLTLIHESR